MVESLKSDEMLKDELKSKIKFITANKKSKITVDSFIENLFESKTSNKFDGFYSGFDEYYEIELMKVLEVNKKEILDFCINHPEKSYDILYCYAVNKKLKPSDFKPYTKQQVMKIPRIIREVIVHPENRYKILMKHRLNNSIYYFIPEDKKWEALEWIAQNTPDKLKTIINTRNKLNYYTRKEVLNHYQEIGNIDQLPESLQAYLEEAENLRRVQSENNKKYQTGRKLAKEKQGWFDENGELVQLFTLADKTPITRVEDYQFIANFFMEQNLSVMDFCRQFQIENVKGFKEMCKRVAYTNEEFANYYEQLSDRKQKELMIMIKKEIANVANGTLSVEDAIETSKIKRSFFTMYDIADSIVGYNELNEYIRKVVDYYYNRVNSYDDYSSNPEDLDKRLTEKEVRYLITSHMWDRLAWGENIRLGASLIAKLEPSVKALGEKTRNQMFDRKLGLKRKLASYSSFFKSAPYINGEIQFIVDGGKQVQTNSNMVDMAETYAKSHGLFKSHGTMTMIMKAVAEGKIQNQKETGEYKELLKREICKKMEECKTLENYFYSRRDLER